MRGARRLLLAVVCATAVACGSGAQAALRYVNAALTTGLNNGSSWANVYQGADGLSAALNAASAGDDIWVAQGTYKPTQEYTSGQSQSKTFSIGVGIKVYGGFEADESALIQRNPFAYRTILSGDIDNDNILDADNAWHVARIQTPSGGTAIVDSTRLDGFEITMGYADGQSPESLGGGLLIWDASPVIQNCNFVKNWG